MQPRESQRHDFGTQKTWAAAMAESTWLVSLYRQAFPGYLDNYIIRDDGWAQRGGIDRKINLKSARSIHIEEKFRKRDYGDFFLERWSDVERRKPGWIQQDLLADYVAYVFVPSQRLYLLPYLDLKRAWRRHGRYWIGLYGTELIPNRGYKTEGVPVPIPVVLKALVDGAYFQSREEPGGAPAGWVSPQLAFDFGGIAS